MADTRPSEFAVTRVDPENPTLEVEEVAPRTLPANLAARVREHFDAECREREARGIGGELYDGTLFSLVDEPGPRLRGRFIAYSEWVAQLREPALRADLEVRPLGVTGAIECGNEVWFGLRSPGTFLLAGLWELCPSGGVDLDARDTEGRIDPRRQLALELEEELGWPAAGIAKAEPFAFVEDPAARVVDIAYRVHLRGSAAELRDAIAGRANREYQRVEGVAFDRLAEVAVSGLAGAALAPVAVAMLEAGGWLGPAA